MSKSTSLHRHNFDGTSFLYTVDEVAALINVAAIQEIKPVRDKQGYYDELSHAPAAVWMPGEQRDRLHIYTGTLPTMAMWPNRTGPVTARTMVAIQFSKVHGHFEVARRDLADVLSFYAHHIETLRNPV